MMKLAFSVMFIVFCVSAYAQRVTGYVRDATSGETLIGASVIKSSGAGNVTNQHGFYAINILNKDTLTFTYLGHATKIINVFSERDTVINISLTPISTEIAGVKIVGKQQLVRFSDLGYVSVNMQQLKLVPLFLGEQDIFKYLQLLPGVMSGKEGSSGLNVRGGSSDQSLILLDDVPLYNQAHTFGFLSIFSGDAIKSAELYKGHIPAQYGGRLSSIVSMRMKDGNRKEHHQAITVGTISIGGTLEGPIVKNKGSYIISARKFVPDLFLRVYNWLGKPEDKIIYNFYDVTGKVNYDLNDRNTLYLSVYHGGDFFNVRNDQFDDAGKKVTTSKGGFSWGNTMVSLRLNSTIGSKFFLSNTIYYSRQQNYKDGNYKMFDAKYKFDSNIWSAMDEVGFKSLAEQNVSEIYNLSYGISGAIQFFNPKNTYSNKNGKKRTLRFDNRTLYSGAVFIDNKISMNKININIGLRGAYYDNGKSGLFSFEPRLALTARFSDKYSVWLSYTVNTQPIMSAKLFYFALPLDFWTPYANNNLQKAQQFSLGTNISSIKNLSVTAEIYYKPMKNIALIYDSDDYIADDGGVDFSKGQAYGAELNLQYQRERYALNLSYTYSRSFRIIDGQKYLFEYDTPHVLNIFGNYDVFKRTNRTHTLSMNISYKTGIPLVFTNEVFPSGVSSWDSSWISTNTPKYPNTRMPDYFRIDISYNMEKIKKNGVRNWQFSILNVTNHKNPYVIFTEKDGRTNTISFKQLTLIPIMPSISYRRTF